MELKHKLEKIFNNDYPGTDRFIADVIVPIFGNEIEYINDDLAERENYAEKAKNAGIRHIKYIGDLTEKNYNADNIALLDVTLDESKNIERSRVNIQQLIRSIMDYRQHLMIIFHYEDVTNRQWRFSYAYKGDSLKDTTSAKRYTYVFGRDYRGRTAAERFEVLSKSPRRDEDFEKAFSVAALSDEFFDKYRDIYADFVQYITGKRYEKVKNKWEEVKKDEPITEIFSQFNNDDKRVRDYIKKMLGRLTFLCFLQRKGWMNNDRNFLQNLYQTSLLQADFLDAVLEPLFFGVLNTPPEKRKEVFVKNGWNTDLVAEWSEIPYLNGGLFEQTHEDKLTVKFPKNFFQELFKFLGEYNFTIDENNPDDAEIGIDPEMLGRVFESLLEDNKDKGAFYTPKEIVQYMCRQSIIEYLKTHTEQSLHADIEDLINKGLVNHALQSKDNARTLYKLLKEVTVCDPAIGSGAFPMSILNILFTARQHLYGFLKESEPFNPLEVKKDIIRNNIYGVDIEQGAVDIARLRFWLAILVEEQFATPLPNLDYRIVRGNSLITSFNDEYIQLPDNPDGRTKLAKLKKELHQLQNELFDLNGNKKLQREIEIKCKILEIVKVQLGIDKANAQAESRVESDIFEDKKLSGKALKKAKQARAIEEVKSKSLFALNNLMTSLTTPATSLADRAQIDIKFFDWKILFSNIFDDNTSAYGFDIVIGNPPYNELRDLDELSQIRNKSSKYYEFAKGGRVNMFQFFYPLAIDILKIDGICSLITQNSLLAEDSAVVNRKLIFGTSKIIHIDSFPERDDVKKRVFKSAKMSVCIGIIQKVSNNSTDIPPYQFSVHIWEDKNMDNGNVLNINKTEIDNIYPNDLIIPICDNERWQLLVKLKQQGSFSIDAQAGEIDMTKYRPLFSSNTSFYRVLTGAQVQRYHITDTPSQGNLFYINPELLSLSPSRKKAIANPRIVMQRITGVDSQIRLVSTLVQGNILCANSTNYISPDKNSFDIYVLLGLLNSKLLNFFIKQTSTNTNVTGKEIAGFPIKSFGHNSDIFIDLVKELLKPSSDYHSSATENQIDNIVYHLYDLTYDEVLIIDPQTPISRAEYESFNLDAYGQS
ncbi:TaqI-like C-terminal specificity domain-containing protein [uncultured Bacteroides sp.]|uniref:Eco57I restriction-modification methylase domain-containing protein n=1 Tax=uncultured Bacteroides sp. TaxID=162156 RepID=UPI0025999C67|nr:TaqI-like C-terminal specificity domain-containing protein [uncultured Bacteroides sp.]